MKLLILLMLPIMIKAACNECSCVDENGYATIDSDTINFMYCQTLKHAILSEGVTEIAYPGFAETTNLESIVLPSTLTRIDYSSFDNSGLTSIVIPDGVTHLGSQAFRNSGLTSLTLPDTLSTWENEVFYGTNINQLCGVDASVYTSASYPLEFPGLDQSTQEQCTYPFCPEGTSDVKWCTGSCNPGEGLDGCTPCTDAEHSDGTTDRKRHV